MKRAFIYGLFFVLSTYGFITVAGAEHSYPRLGGYLISGPFSYDDPAYQRQIAKLDMVVLNMWPGWASSTSSREGVIANIKNLNPEMRVFQYYDNNELANPAPAPFRPVEQKANEMGWWLYLNGGSGVRVNSAWQDFVSLNTTQFTPRDSTGKNFLEWNAQWVLDNYSRPVPSSDGLFIDNVFWRPRINGDWNRDGITDDKNNPTVQQWFRDGYKRYFSLLDAGQVGKYNLGNLADWGANEANLTGYTNIVSGGVFEFAIGMGFSVESWASYSDFLKYYRKIMANVAAPKFVIFHQVGGGTDFQAMRYGLATCLMDEGYFHYAVDDKRNRVDWFDEFDHDLGMPLTAPPATAWRDGVFRRDFENGIALVNPKGNGARTIQLDGTFRKIPGTQDPAVNSGQTVTQVTLKDRDGLILLRNTSITKPLPPSGVRVD